MAHCDLRCLHQQHAQHAIALLGDCAQLLPSARGVLARNQAQIAGHLLAAWKAADVTHGQHIGQRGDRTHSGLGLQKQRHFVSLGFFFHRLVQRRNLLIEHGHQLQQVLAAARCQAGSSALPSMVPRA